MEPDEIRELIRALDTTNITESENAWAKLRSLGEDVLPFFVELFPSMRKWQGRVWIVFHSMKYAHFSEIAFQIGVFACNDKATLVRYRACQLLAMSQRKDALPHLRKLLDHKDVKTSADAAAAIDAIKHKNADYFIDRDHTGRITISTAGIADALHQSNSPSVISQISSFIGRVFNRNRD